MKIIQVYDKLGNHGGVQKILFNLDEYLLKQGFDPYIAGAVSFNDFYFKNTINKDRYFYLSLRNILHFRKSIVISHSRKITTFLILLNKIFHLKIKIIHVSHSIFKDKRYLTLYPKNIIAISYAVKDNLIKYFKVPKKNIQVIYNGVEDTLVNFKPISYNYNNKVKIVLIGRIEELKQQVKIVDYLSGKLNNNISIDFVGNGSQVKLLQETIKKKGKKNFKYIPFNNQVDTLIQKYHYTLLFSEKEGLGLTLIESCMVGRAIITRGNNGCKACSEICIDKYNGLISNTFDDLIKTLNNLIYISEEEYVQLCKHARKQFKEKFTKKMMFQNYLEYINKVRGEL